MVKRVKASDLRNQKPHELQAQLEELKGELYQLRFQKVTQGPSSQMMNIRRIRKSIACIHTVMTEKKREELRKLYKDSKYLPLDLRTKGTRAYRRRLPEKLSQKRTQKVTSRRLNFPARVYALKN
mmetsp:Transcript_12844/g.19346  ORF Transcript_12844/g.19346 Transcript_12844/m.19346 type:complete len:125 (+) Transcript_12844:55-429(+)